MEATATKLIEKQCQRHLAAQGITSMETFQHRLQEIFEQGVHLSACIRCCFLIGIESNVWRDIR